MLKSENGNFLSLLKKAQLFKDATPAFFAEMQAHASLLKANKGKILFVNGDEALRFFIVKNGWVKIFRETVDGTQAVVDILTDGHFFGETSIFHDDRYSYSAEVVEPSEILSLPISTLKTEIEENSKMAIAMMSSMARYRRYQDQELEHRILQNAPQRIGCFLLRLSNQNVEGKMVINLPYDKTLLALRLGMQPETFSRALSKLKDITGMRVKGGSIELDDIGVLVKFACSACSSEFPCKDAKIET